ncbi:hypothetical protein PCZ31_3144 [Clostridioides difficile]|nr:hypothetical protein PCZ31_3144 [Clostridioides difficile]
MMNNELNTIILETLNNADITSNDIPSIDLYMDQIISLIDNKLSANKRFESDKILTKTMINNYSKEGLIKPVKGKKYTKEQILQMIIIYSMKNTLTIQEIKRILHGVYEKDNFSEKDLVSCYEKFMLIKENQRKNIPDFIESNFENISINPENKDDLLIALLSLTSMADQLKNISEKLVDRYFPDITKNNFNKVRLKINIKIQCYLNKLLLYKI